tara:strand:- start:175 stop:402 length:228 start_codon:yes stop_codon:yes gene_type:complete
MSITKQNAYDYITAKSQRIYAHKNESDPLLAQYMAEEIEKSVWLDKKAEIKKRFPYPEGCSTADLEQYCKDNNLG